MIFWDILLYIYRISQKLKENIQTAVKQIKINKIETSYIQSIGSFLFCAAVIIKHKKIGISYNIYIGYPKKLYKNYRCGNVKI